AVQEAHPEDEVADGSQIARKSVPIELERIRPSHVCMPAADIGVIEIANPVFDGASLFACVMPHDVTKPECVGIAFTREHLLNQGGTVKRAMERAGAGRGELALRQHMTWIRRATSWSCGSCPRGVCRGNSAPLLGADRW